jgi:hypothetical protein
MRLRKAFRWEIAVCARRADGTTPSFGEKRGTSHLNRWLSMLLRMAYGTPERGYSPRKCVRPLPQWGHRAGATIWSATWSRA